MIKNLVFVAIGGALGACLRYLFSLMMQPFSVFGVYIGTVLINIIGSFGLGIFSAYISKANISSKLSLLISVGIFGALTTFSTFSKEIIELIEDEKLLEALLYLLISVIFGILMFYFGKILFSKTFN